MGADQAEVSVKGGDFFTALPAKQCGGFLLF
jgi:hypothetical protein